MVELVGMKRVLTFVLPFIAGVVADRLLIEHPSAGPSGEFNCFRENGLGNW